MFFILLCLLFLACAPQETSTLNYATFTPGREVMKQWSAYTTIERRGCTLPIQLYAFPGADVPPEQGAFVRRAVESAVKAWASAPAWPCTATRVVWAEAGPGTVQVYLDPTVTRAYTIVGQNQVYLSHANTVPTDPLAERIILHEFGHIFGLADTYSEPGYQQPLNQPPGIMNRLWEVNGLSGDDIRGAAALYEYINGRRPFCDNGYVVGAAYENVNRVAFCVPTFGPNQPPPDSTIKSQHGIILVNPLEPS
jgi:hypothetical protein